jgi:CheY-like chemotaxis protein
MRTDLPLRVLVVDDDPVMREVLFALLSLEGHEIQMASSGDEAVTVLTDADDPPDVVLTDLHMPGLEGRELAERLLEVRPAKTLLIGMSGSRPTNFEIDAFDAFLHKPFQTSAFAEAANKAEARRVQPASGGQTEASAPDSAAPRSADVLDEKIFNSLAMTLPASQLRELYELTLRDVRERLELMNASRKAGNLDQVRREAHAIKGACGMVGAAELRELATKVEGGSAGNTPPLADFPAACERLRRMLDTRLQAPQATH